MASHSDELTDIVPDEPLLNQPVLLPYLRERVPFGDGPVSVRRFRGGHANINFLISAAGRQVVLRRPPPGPLPPKAHDMKREFRVLQLIHPVYPLAPRALLFSEDEALIGAPFLVMERRDGIVLRGPELLLGNPDRNRRVGDMLIDTLAKLHSLDPAPMMAARLGNPDGFAQRQVVGWTARWQAARHGEGGAVDAVGLWLQRNVPASARIAVLHNDYKLDNLIVSSSDFATPEAVVDWDMCTVGDPLFDLGLLLAYWGEKTDAANWITGASMPTYVEGFPTRREASARYAERTGADLSQLDWYVVFAVFRIIVALAQIYRRFATGQTQDERFAIFGERMRFMTDKAERLVADADL